jgi:hypothetical protein
VPLPQRGVFVFTGKNWVNDPFYWSSRKTIISY